MITTAIALACAGIYFTLGGGFDIGKWLLAGSAALVAIKVLP